MSKNRQRVSNIFHQMNLVLSDEGTQTKDISRVLKRLLNGGAIDEEQYNTLTEKLDELNIDKVLGIVGKVKVGRGVSFLPRNTEDLSRELHEWGHQYAEKPTDDLKTKIKAALDELLFRRAITKENYKDIKEVV